ncbi:hypothetical protein Goarm_006992 [Gossypium armourianum]|uniref:Uncharacterized protein n=1 Tax=Gossypium armourianum TaxID=34283 RepID=A0A7J9JJS5_9ROSI|nr:hypothetical protein [Gossypium armourianum]
MVADQFPSAVSLALFASIWCNKAIPDSIHRFF